ncbi:hypothetical protein [Azohydromonas australica]|uniref:hypothetical protein n=1 Tax=Azohydromonas australica TaxID=364039 RepID=UPI0004242086|nr:hypothetical protein [Azohydromonas australica]
MSTIELSTVVFYEGSLPSVLPLWNCSVPLVSPVPDALTAVYGTTSKPDAFAAAYQYAKRNQLQHTVIDVTVTLEHRPNPTVMRAETLGSYDFFSMRRMATSMEGQIVEWIRAGLAPDDRRAKLFDEMLPTQVLAREPSLLGVLMDSPACRHLKLLACPAQTMIDLQVFNVGVVPFRHWSAIQEATCRFDPSVKISLEPPPAFAAKLAVPSSNSAG